MTFNEFLSRLRAVARNRKFHLRGDRVRTVRTGCCPLEVFGKPGMPYTNGHVLGLRDSTIDRIMSAADWRPSLLLPCERRYRRALLAAVGLEETKGG